MSDTAERVKKIVVEHLNVDADKVTDTASFIEDLGADSLDTVELVMAFEEEFGIEIPDDAAESIVTSVTPSNISTKRTPPDPAYKVLKTMRRVVITAWVLSRPGLRRGGDLVAAACRAIRRQPHHKFRVDDLPTRSPARVPRGDGSDGTFNPTSGWMPRNKAHG